MLGPEEGHLTGLERVREGSLEGRIPELICKGCKVEKDIPGRAQRGEQEHVSVRVRPPVGDYYQSMKGTVGNDRQGAGATSTKALHTQEGSTLLAANCPAPPLLCWC